ncbi:hypothetical protein [Streptomyces lincolnensis]|uniref:hypothetical protein n=1 Tax=Streptomyces lincolnensis TaxID=1915 RepID=UPI0037D7B5E9
MTLSEDGKELLDVATRAGARCMGADRAEAFGRRNAVPNKVAVRLRPSKVIAYGGITD